MDPESRRNNLVKIIRRTDPGNRVCASQIPRRQQDRIPEISIIILRKLFPIHPGRSFLLTVEPAWWITIKRFNFEQIIFDRDPAETGGFLWGDFLVMRFGYFNELNKVSIRFERLSVSLQRKVRFFGPFSL